MTTPIGVDVGGTFTDVALVVGGELVTAKVPTTADQSVGVLDGITKACRTANIAPDEIDDFSHAMTVSVNALLERDGATTALVTTAGFRDVLEIARQDRPDLYDLDATKPEPLVPRARRFEVDERATVDGIEREVNPAEIRALAGEIEATGAESVGICLLHAYAHPENEHKIAEILREELDIPVSVSSDVLPEFREFERTATTVVDAYVTPAIRGYLDRLTDRAADAGVPEPRVMQANGGIAAVETVREKAVLTTMSGPAAGVVGAAATLEATTDRVVTFDMGGTSTDVSLVQEGRAERTAETEIDGIPIRTPIVDVTTVGAGGGSIAWTDAGGALRVGPRSAGAEPGPACYGNGGTEPTVTDANVVLGAIGEDTALGGELTLDVEAAYTVLGELAEEAGLADAEAAARGVFRVANATMTRAIRSVTVERGHDPREFGLVAFGGAGPMHAVALAAELDMSEVIIPAPAGVLSAFGLLAADETHDALQTVKISLSEAARSEIERTYERLAETVLADCSAPETAHIERAADCRYVGQSFELTIPVDEISPEAVARRFADAHEQTYGYTLSAPIEIVNLRVTATIDGSTPAISHAGSGESVIGSREAIFPGAEGDSENSDRNAAHNDMGSGGETDGTDRILAAVYDRSKLAVDAPVSGPAILEQAESTTVVPPGWTGRIRSDGTLVLRRAADGNRAATTHGEMQ